MWRGGGRGDGMYLAIYWRGRKQRILGAGGGGHKIFWRGGTEFSFHKTNVSASREVGGGALPLSVSIL